MTKRLAFALAASLALPSLATAASGLALDTDTEAAIRTMLTEQGYEVRKIQIEDGFYEAYALRDGKRMEIYLNAQLEIVKGADGDDAD